MTTKVRRSGCSPEFVEQCRRACPSKADLARYGVVVDVAKKEVLAVAPKRGRPPGSKNKV